MQKISKKNTLQFKTIKLDSKTHKLLRMYAAEKDLHLGEAVRNLLQRRCKNNHKR